jgi:hypothetical protein
MLFKKMRGRGGERGERGETERGESRTACQDARERERPAPKTPTQAETDTRPRYH